MKEQMKEQMEEQLSLVSEHIHVHVHVHRIYMYTGYTLCPSLQYHIHEITCTM